MAEKEDIQKIISRIATVLAATRKVGEKIREEKETK